MVLINKVKLDILLKYIRTVDSKLPKWVGYEMDLNMCILFFIQYKYYELQLRPIVLYIVGWNLVNIHNTYGC